MVSHEFDPKKAFALLEEIVGGGLYFNAYGTAYAKDLRISKENYWNGFYSSIYNFVSIIPTHPSANCSIIFKIKNIFEKIPGWKATPIINDGISLTYSTMSSEEINSKLKDNLYRGGRTSN